MIPCWILPAHGFRETLCVQACSSEKSVAHIQTTTYDPAWFTKRLKQQQEKCELSHLSVQSLHANTTKLYMTYSVPLSWCWEQAQLAVEGGACFTFRKKKAVVLSCPISSLRSVNLLRVLGTSFRNVWKDLWSLGWRHFEGESSGGCKDTTPVLLRRIHLGEGWRWFVEALCGSLSYHGLCCACFLR